MAYFNAQGQGRVGWRSGVSAAPAPVTVSTLLTSLYSVWNGDTTTSTLDSSIYGAWNGENNANDSVSTNHGTLMNGCTFTTGKVGQAFSFDGVNDYVALPNNSLNLTGDFTIAFWFYHTASGAQTLISNLYYQTTPTNIYKGWGLYIDNLSSSTNKLGFIIPRQITDYVGFEFNTSLTLNAWNHVIITRVSGVDTYAWINNTLSTTTYTGPINSGNKIIDPSYHTTQRVSIGAQNGSGTPATFMSANSKIDGLTIWNKQLTSDERTQLYNLGTGTQYPFSGQTLPSANNQFAIDNGTLMNGCTFTDGKIGKAFTFDGVNDYIKLPSNSLSFTSDFSVSFWMKLGSLGQTSYIIDSAGFGGIGTTGWVLNLSSGNLNFTIHNNNTLQSLAANYLLTSTSVWYHVVITSKSGYNAIYLNNSLITSNTSTMRPNYVSSSYDIPYIGVFKTANTQFFYGNIDSLTTWQKSLSQAEVTELYNSGAGKQLTVATPIVTNGLVLNLDASRLSSYPNAGTTWTDISGNGNNGTMTNGPIFGTANGGVITFDGINDRVSSFPTQFPNTNSKTIDMWFKTNSSTRQGLCGVRSASTGWVFCINRGSTGNLTYFNTGQGEYQIPAGITTNTWYNAIVTHDYSVGTIKIYLNGNLLGTASLPGYISSSFNGVIGDEDNSFTTPFNGDICQTKIYNRALSSTEITQNYNATKSRFGL